MPPKGKRRGGPPQPRPLSPTLARKRKRGSEDEPSPPSRWSWVKLDVKAADQINPKHMAWSCGFAEESGYTACVNKWSKEAKSKEDKRKGKEVDTLPVEQVPKTEETQKSDVIDLTAPAPCDKKKCRDNPNCLNHLGQEAWEDEEEARQAFLKVAKLGFDPRELNRDMDIPVGLRNLGATCYANAFIQVWFQDLAFRTGVYACKPTAPEGKLLEDAPLFQLQVTFAALQQCRQNVYNPIKLVESLGLRTSEQQDATEFGKLFMNLLGEQFQLQDAPSVKTLLRDQFEGHLTYCTTCKGCNHTSERDSPFLELELNLGPKSHLEERILEVLQKEELTGDNKYMCSRCDSLNDATRWVKLRDCPSVLHFSLMRFVYDVRTYERKKSKKVIQFPLTLNMRPFISGGAVMDDQIYELRGVLLHRGASAYHGHYVAQAFDLTKQQWFEFNDEDVTPIDKVMEGQAGSGGAETSKSSQTLGKRKTPSTSYKRETGSSKRSKSADGNESDESPIRKGKKKTTNIIELSDDEIEEEAEQPASSPTRSMLPTYSRSKDAYMLIYARRDVNAVKRIADAGTSEEFAGSSEGDHKLPLIPQPPPDAVEEVNRINDEHDRSCQEYMKREQVVLDLFAQVRAMKQEVYENWHIQSHDDDSIVVKADDLKKWLGQGIDLPKQVAKPKDEDIEIIESAEGEGPSNEADIETNTPEDSAETPMAVDPSTFMVDAETTISITPLISTETDTEHNLSDADSARTLVSSPPAIGPTALNTNWLQGTITADSLCDHGLIVPPANTLKRIRKSTYERLLSLGVHFEPALAHTEVCSTCTERILFEHIYAVRHPEQVKLFNDRNIHYAAEDVAFWISKPWLRDWSNTRPKMHVEGQPDPAPNANPWKSDVVCEHGDLTLSEKDRKVISVDAYRMLRSIYPDWQPFSTAHDVCPVCEAVATETSGLREDLRKAAEQEKARLKSMFTTNPLANRPVSLIEGFAYAVVPSSFMRAWRSWLIHPTYDPRPATLDTSMFFCQHDKLYFDPNEAVDMEDIDLVVIKENEWKILSELYPTSNNMIRLEPTTHIDEDETVRNLVACNHEVCKDCRRERKSAFEEAPVIIYFMDITDPLPIGETTATDQEKPPSDGNDDLDIVTVTSKAGTSSSPVKSESTLDAYGYGNGSNFEGGVRKSKRLRQTRQRGIKKTITIRKGDSVKEIKVQLFELFSLPTIYQRLFHGGREITELNEKTVAELGILAQDTISLLERGSREEEATRRGTRLRWYPSQWRRHCFNDDDTSNNRYH
ncbi:cysteine proteinase [Calocera cornea HHB12733]|uniref:Cysteine proteinase n=1 Tax=Calocera cornea HHB12733 TaxID=1353952 RepID=A0A165E2W5_9BASI|nr:cysteine proteinase [Calocera cornea HHB12733]